MGVMSGAIAVAVASGGIAIVLDQAEDAADASSRATLAAGAALAVWFGGRWLADQ